MIRSARNGLHLVAAEVLVVQVLEPAAQFLVVSRLGHRRDRFRRLQHRLFDVDRAIQPQREARASLGRESTDIISPSRSSQITA